MRRHRLAVASVGLVAVAIVGGAAVALWQAKVARGEARRAQNVKRFIAHVFTEATPRTGVGGEVTAADLLTAASRRLQASLDEEPRVAVELGVLIGEAFDALGETGKGLAAVKIAAALGEQELGPLDPLTLRARSLLIGCHDALGQFEESEKLVPALIADSRAGLPGSARILVGALSAQSFEQAKREQADESVASLKEAIEVAERHLGKDDDETIRSVGLLANTYGRFGDWVRQLEAAEDALRRSTAKYGAQRPHDVLLRSERWYAEALLFNLRPTEAVEIVERVVEDQRRLAPRPLPVPFPGVFASCYVGPIPRTRRRVEMNVDKVIEAYRNADEEEQICLFLAYRDLREMFTGIDAELPARETSRKQAVTG